MPKLLLHICCAPCGAFVCQGLMSKFEITLYFFNPNINTREEFEKRLAEIRKLVELYNLPLIVVDYDHASWIPLSVGLENEPEKGARCRACYQLRLQSAVDYAKANGYDNVATTLTISPYKDSVVINQLGQQLASEQGLKFIEQVFTLDDYYASVKLAKELNFYRQKYCGCEFSLRK